MPILGVLVGVVLTALVQSSTIVTGLAIIMVQQGILSAPEAIPIVIGTNMGNFLHPDQQFSLIPISVFLDPDQ